MLGRFPGGVEDFRYSTLPYGAIRFFFFTLSEADVLAGVLGFETVSFNLSS